jgi:putative CocE/NonD family hydrolase
MLLAAARHPKHITAVPQSSASGFNIRGRPWASFDGGVFELAQTAGWFSGGASGVDYATLPVIDVLQKAGLPPSDYEHFVASNPEGEYFKNLEWVQRDDLLDVPMLFFDSWYDYGPAETLELFNHVRTTAPSAVARDHQFVVIAPVTHCGYRNMTEHTVVGERELGDARLDIMDLRLRWYDYWLKGIDNGITAMPKVQYYVMGRNVWQSAVAWPVPGTRYEKLYLQAGGVLAFEPSAVTGGDTYRYDPGSPVPTLGGHTCCTGLESEAGGYDQSATEQRDDVLVYTSALLEKGIEVTGPLEVILQVSSTAPDTDFTAKQVDV